MADNIQLRDEGAVVQGCGTGAVHAEQKEMVIQAVVHIDTNDPKVGRGSGFIAELPISRVEKKVVLMTCNHVLPSLAVAQKANIYFGRRSKTNPGTMIEGQELFNDQFFLTDDRTFPMWKRRFDYTVVEVKTDVLQKHLEDQAPKPLPLTKCADMMKTEGLCLNNMLYMVHFPKQPVAFDRYENAEQICRIEGPYIGHMAESYGGSSGSPMLREYNNELIVVGLHRGDLGSQGHTYVNIATLITVILDDIRMVDYDDSKFPELGSFATEAKKHAKELKSLPQKRSTPPKEAGVNPQNQPESSSPEHRNGGESNGGQSADAVLAMKVHASGLMKKWNCDALTALKGDLKLKVKLGNGLIDKLETAAGGFMSKGEAQAVEGMPNNAAQVGKVIEILEGKSDAAFGIFCRMLRESGYEVWADELEKKAKELRGDAGGPPQQEPPQPGPPHADVLSQKIHNFKTKDNKNHLAILREYVSKVTVGYGRDLLEKLGRTRPQINKYYSDNPQSEEQAIQDGLLAWVGKVDPTWGDLLKAMEEMAEEIGIQASNDLKAKLCQ